MAELSPETNAPGTSESAWRETAPPRVISRIPWRDLFAWASLAGATLLACWPLGLTNRILAGVDAFTYFLPYWVYRIDALRAGRLPLWNPYLFLGAPYLANPQTAVLYPLHWLLNGLPPPQALIWSALLHLWLAAGFMLTFARRSLGMSRASAWLAGVLFALGGFTLGKIENINQLNGLAWLPALLWLFDETRQAADWRGRIRWGIGFCAVIALQLLAGHTQTAFINLVGLAAYACVRTFHVSTARPFRRRFTGLLPLVAVIPALLLTAAQLLPTLELTNLGLRTGGLTYRLAVSFSLRPRLLAQTLLPPLDGGLAAAFGSEGFTEFSGYVGVVGLILAGLGLANLFKPRAPASSPPTAGLNRPAFVGLALLAGLGLFLALGAYNPLYYLLWRFVPGFDLFRVPARWLALYAVVIAGLAGAGLDVWRTSPPRLRGEGGSPLLPSQRGRWVAGAILHPRSFLALLAGVAFLASQQFPGARTLLGWGGMAALAALLLWLGRRWPRPALSGLLVLTLAELWLAGRALPFALATAPAAVSLRNAPAALLAATAGQPPAGRDRFLSMSDIRYDPGDLAELRALQADRLPAEAVERFVRAAKWAEVIAPNLSLLWRLPALDGYDGGVLPTADYGRLQALFLPEESRLPDGRLREQLRTIPPARLLDLAGVRFVITDKQQDLWADDIYYDLEQTVLLQPGDELTLSLTTYPPFSATALGVVAAAEPLAGQDGSARAAVHVTGADGQAIRLDLAQQAAPADAPPRPALLTFPSPMTPITITVESASDAPAPLRLRGLSLLDGRTAAHQSLTLSPGGDLRRIHSGDVKVYERTAAPGRVWLTHGVRVAREQDEAFRILADPSFDPRTTVILSADLAAQAPSAALPGESVQVVAFDAERLVVRADVLSPAVLVLADAFFPGWAATVDGAAAPILRANGIFRAVALQPGSHEIILWYDPAAWRWGWRISLVALVGLVLTFVASFTRISHS